MGIYTRTGDEGQTSVIGGRVVKDDDRVEAYGTIDELNCFVGQAISLIDDAKGSFEDLKEQLSEIQQELFDCGSDLAFVNITENRYKVKDDKVARLEQWIDLFDTENPKVERFIIMGAPCCLLRFTYAVPCAVVPNAGQSR